ncbi:MAG TPA: F0F1 ATP synthase subunit epsilon [Chloroflexota bacterium]|nr:F0F1 ATP synthase subunit epsilon [Chloroflexota bacterium]
MAKLRLEIVTAEREVFADDVDMVVAPGGEGEVGILPRHAPLLTTLQPGVLRLKKDGDETYLAVSGGFMQVYRDRVLVLADTAERAEEIEEERAESARQRALAALQQRGGGDAALQAEAARLALRRSLVRLQVVRRRQRRTAP